MSAAVRKLRAALTGAGRLDREADELAADFPAFYIDICRGRQGRSLIALRLGSMSEPGLTAVITPDAAEMRAVLSEDSPPGAGKPPGGG